MAVKARRNSFVHNDLDIAGTEILRTGDTLISGSLNFNKATEESNTENLLILNKPMVDRFIQNFESQKEHSEGYAGR